MNVKRWSTVYVYTCSVGWTCSSLKTLKKL